MGTSGSPVSGVEPDSGASPRLRYEQVKAALESAVLERALTDISPLPPEPELMRQFGVSRGTLRRAVDELVREGLLVPQQGRGTYANQEERLRRFVWQHLAPIAEADSRFDLDLRNFVPDFDGRSRADRRVVARPEWKSARTIFLMPDNSLRALREAALHAGKKLLVPTFGFRRGFIVLDPERIDERDHSLAATLDGMERLGKRLDAGQLGRLKRVDLVVTGATAVLLDGRVVGRGEPLTAHALTAMTQLGIFDETVPVIAVVHDCQIIGAEVPASPECTVNFAATPTRLIVCEPDPWPEGDRSMLTASTNHQTNDQCHQSNDQCHQSNDQ